jgi:hypothetical protein
LDGRITRFVQELMERRRGIVPRAIGIDFVWFRARASIVQNVFTRYAPSVTFRDPITSNIGTFERIEARSRDQFIRELFTRTERLESIHSGTMVGKSTNLPFAFAGSPVSRVFVRPALQALVSGAAAAPATADAQSSGRPARKSETVDLHRLTDEVVQAIDRRIVAQRERLGRV